MGVSQENTHYEIAETVFSVEGQRYSPSDNSDHICHNIIYREISLR